MGVSLPGEPARPEDREVLPHVARVSIQDFGELIDPCLAPVLKQVVYDSRKFRFSTPRPEFAASCGARLVVAKECREVSLADVPARSRAVSVQPAVSHHEVDGRSSYSKAPRDILKTHEAVGIMGMFQNGHGVTVSALRVEVVDPRWRGHM
jgi:hypothetical protein